MNFRPIASSSKGNCYILEAAGVAPLMIEAGIPARRMRGAGVVLTGLAGALVTHCHGDHASGVKDLLKASVDVHMSQETAEAIGAAGHHRVSYIDTYHTYDIKGWLVTPFNLHHDVETHGFYISSSDGDNLLFIPDTSYVRERFAGITLLAIECNNIEELLNENIADGTIPVALGRRVRRNHMSLERVVNMLKANDLSRCRSIWLLHLSDQNSDEARMIRAVQEATGIPCRACQEAIL